MSKNFTFANICFCRFKFCHNRINGFSAVAACAGICGLPMRINPSKLLAQWQLPNSSSIKSCQHVPTRPHGMCYSHLGNGVRNGVISITKWGFISDYCKVKPIGQWGKILVMAMGIVDHLGASQYYEIHL